MKDFNAQAVGSSRGLAWHGVPDDLRAIVEPLLLRRWNLLPRWVALLDVRYSPDDNDAILSTHIKPEYRKGAVFICPRFFAVSPEERDSTIIHEFVHFHLEAMRDVLWHAIETLTKDDTLRAVLREQLRIANESATCDIVDSLEGALGIGRQTAIPT